MGSFDKCLALKNPPLTVNLCTNQAFRRLTLNHISAVMRVSIQQKKSNRVTSGVMGFSSIHSCVLLIGSQRMWYLNIKHGYSLNLPALATTLTCTALDRNHFVSTAIGDKSDTWKTMCFTTRRTPSPDNLHPKKEVLERREKTLLEAPTSASCNNNNWVSATRFSAIPSRGLSVRLVNGFTILSKLETSMTTIQ